MLQKSRKMHTIMTDNHGGLIVSTHIPKNGGNTFVDFLNKVYGSGVFLDYADMPLSLYYPLHHWLKAFKKPCLAPHIRCVHGHFLTGKYDHVSPPLRYVVWLRDPVERVLSHYYFWVRNPDHTNSTCRKFLRTDQTIESFLKIRRLRDVQSRYMNGRAVNDFDFVGVVEDFDRGLALYRKIFGIRQDVEVASLNVNHDRAQARYDVKEELRDLIRAANPRDVTLYMQGCSYYDDLLRAYGVS